MSEKKRDRYNRWRNRTVAFRASPEEAHQLDIAVKLSGLSKREYICNRCLERDIIVVGNPRVYKALKDQLAQVLEELQRLSAANEMTPELVETVNLIAVTLNGMKEESL